ncbi:MAG: glycosyltransferase family 4 protein, partial [Candidatus Heimdallarchaeota archaeon]|nr:glycosyltransferase family 4 protein [Candidatus Heimdallarchaeota archaeon]
MKMKILMLLSNPFRPDPRVYNEALSLVKAGHEVEVLAWDRLAQYPKNDVIDGIKITRVRNTRFMQLLPRDMVRLKFFWRLAYKIALTKKFDVVHCHDLDTLPTGVKLKKKFDMPLIYDAHEIFGYMLERDLPKFIANYFLKLEKKLVNYSDHVITVTEKHEEYFKKLGC